MVSLRYTLPLTETDYEGGAETLFLPFTITYNLSDLILVCKTKEKP